MLGKRLEINAVNPEPGVITLVFPDDLAANPVSVNPVVQVKFVLAPTPLESKDNLDPSGMGVGDHIPDIYGEFIVPDCQHVHPQPGHIVNKTPIVIYHVTPRPNASVGDFRTFGH